MAAQTSSSQRAAEGYSGNQLKLQSIPPPWCSSTICSPFSMHLGSELGLEQGSACRNFLWLHGSTPLALQPQIVAPQPQSQASLSAGCLPPDPLLSGKRDWMAEMGVKGTVVMQSPCWRSGKRHHFLKSLVLSAT